MFRKNGVGNLEGAVRWAIEAISVAGTIKLLRYGIADWANEGHRLAVLQVHINWGPRQTDCCRHTPQLPWPGVCRHKLLAPEDGRFETGAIVRN